MLKQRNNHCKSNKNRPSAHSESSLEEKIRLHSTTKTKQFPNIKSLILSCILKSCLKIIPTKKI